MNGDQFVSWRLESGANCETYRNGTLLGREPYDSTDRAFNNLTMIGAQNAANDYACDMILTELAIFPTALGVADMALMHAYLSARYALVFSPVFVEGCGAWWDLDNSTQAGGVLLTLTDRALGQTINVVGAPAIVAIGGDDFVRMDGANDVLWITDAAALDGAAGVTHVLKHANTLPNPLAGDHMYVSKGRNGVHWNGGLYALGGLGTRMSVYTGVTIPNVGPLAEFATPAETIAMAVENGVAVRRIDGDGTYASNATVQVTAVGAGSLSWGAYELNAVPTFGGHAGIDLRFGAYYNRPLNRYGLEAVRAYGDAV